MTSINGNIGALARLGTLWFFCRTGANEKKMLLVPCGGERFRLFSADVHLQLATAYINREEFTCKLKNMRS
jgi:hypothetical protein